MGKRAVVKTRTLDLQPDDRRDNDEAAGEQAPIGRQLAHVRREEQVDGRRGGAAGGLDALVEAGEVGQLARVVAERAHDPVDGRLPGRCMS